MLPIELEEKLDPRIKRTRNLIELAFMEVVREKGFQALSIQDLTQRAGINRSTFYAHFQDKYALLDHSIRQGFLEEIDKRMLNACHFSPDNLRNLIMGVCDYIKNTNSHCSPPQKQFESLVESQVKSVLYEILLKWLSELPIDVPPETAATAASWAIYGLALQWSHAKESQQLDEFATEVLPLVTSNLKLVGAA